jgi:iron complex outermembrane receptor protein
MRIFSPLPRTKPAHWIVSASTLLIASPSLAQQAPQSAPAGSTQLEEIVVTAQRRGENIETVPIAIQAFTGQQIKDLGVKSSTDLAQYTSNVEIALPSGAGNQPIIAIRGIGLNDYDTNNAGPNGVYIDEVYLSSPAAQTFQTFDLDRVEVLKGPQGTLYGRNASGGAINLISTKPTDTLSADFHAEYGSYGTANVEGAVSGPIAPDLTGRIAFTVNESDGYFHNTLTGNDENGTNNYAARAMLQYQPASDLKLLLNIHGGQVDNRPTEYRHIGDLDPVTGAQCSVARTYAGQCVDLFGYGTPAKFYDGAFNRQEHLHVDNVGGYLRADYAPGSVDITSISAIEFIDKLHPEDSDASPNRLLEIDYGVRTTTITQELRASQTRDDYNWVGGVYYLHEDLFQNQPLQALLDIDQVFGVPGIGDGVAFQAFDHSHQATDAYAVFGQGEYKITDGLKLILGGRYTYESKSFAYDGSVQFQSGGMDHFGPLMTLADQSESLNDDAFSWRAGLNYNLTPDIMTYVTAATGFKSGDFNGSFLSLTPSEITRQLAPVKPETVTSYEVGLKGSLFDRRLIVNAAAFYNDYQDMQVFTLVPPVAGGSGLPVNVLDNARKAHTEGIDFDLTAKPLSGLTAAAQIGILQAKLDSYVSSRDPTQPDYSGNQLPLSPHLSANLMVNYTIPFNDDTLDLQANANYKSHAFFDVSNSPYLQQGAYWVTNLRVAYSIEQGSWEGAVFVHNLLDTKYFVDEFDLTSPFGLIQGVVGTPRMVGVELNYRY